MTRDAGKGDDQRPRSVSRETWEENFARTFRGSVGEEGRHDDEEEPKEAFPKETETLR